MNHSKIYHAWYSKDMYKYTQIKYIWHTINNKLISATIISNSKKSPMNNLEDSRFQDFIYMGPVIKWAQTEDKSKKENFQKKFVYPKPLSY